MLNEYDTVALTKPIPGATIRIGSQGVVLVVYREPKLAYEVEFVDQSGNSLGNFTVNPDQLRKIDNIDRKPTAAE